MEATSTSFISSGLMLFFTDIMTEAIHWLITITECIGLVIITIALFNAVIRVIQRDENVKLYLAEKLALALEFKLAGEILRTIVASTWGEILHVAAIIGIRALLTLLISWEIHEEEHRLEKRSTSSLTKPSGIIPRQSEEHT